MEWSILAIFCKGNKLAPCRRINQMQPTDQKIPAPNKIRYHHILHDLQALFDQSTDPESLDFRNVEKQLEMRLNLTSEELKLRGLRRAYRQLVEGL